MPGQRLQLKVQKLVDVERAGLVLLIKFDIARLVYFPVKHALFNQELRPFEVAVTGKSVLSRSNESEIHDAT